MINYNSMPKYDDYIDILEWLGGNEPYEDDVWEIARESKQVPIFENILYNIVLSHIYDKIKDKFGENTNISYYINDIDTHLYIDGEKVYDIQNVIEALMQSCDECEGDGFVILSCCGDCMKGQDDDLCRECKEHCGREEEPCETCTKKELI